MQKTRLLKLIDKIFGTLAVCCMAHPLPAGKRDTICSILFIRPGGIGDAVLLIPALLAFRASFPEARITVLAEKRNAAVFGLCPSVDCILLYDRVSDLVRAVQGLYDAVVDTEQWHRLSAIITRLTGAPMSIGFATNNRRKLFTHPLPYSQDDYETISFFGLIAPFGIAASEDFRPPYLAIPETAAMKAENHLNVLSGKPFVVIFPGASIPERRWGVEKFNNLAGKIFNLNIAIVVVGGNEDVSDGDKIIAGKYGLNLAGKTSLTETAAIIEKAKLLISSDSGILHIAVGLDKPTISFFGPGIAKKWAPIGDKHIIINKHLSCSPCTRFGNTPKCPISARCMNEITVDEVFAAVEKQIRTSGV